MLGSFSKRNARYFLFQDMRDARQLVLTPSQYNFLVSEIDQGIDLERENGGYLTVIRDEISSRVVGIYPVPDEFKTRNHVLIPKLEESE